MKIGFTCGAFDLCHAGHVRMLKEAKEQCDFLIVAVQTDPTIDRPDTKNKPVQTIEERLDMMNAIKYVDQVLVYETEADLLELLKTQHVDIRIIGADWKGKPFTGHELPIEIYFNSRDHGLSTSELRRRVYLAEREKIS